MTLPINVHSLDLVELAKLTTIATKLSQKVALLVKDANGPCGTANIHIILPISSDGHWTANCTGCGCWTILAKLEDKLSIRSKSLYSMIHHVSHVYVPFTIDSNGLWLVQVSRAQNLASLRKRGAIGQVTVEYLNSIVLGICNIHISCFIYSYISCISELQGAIS